MSKPKISNSDLETQQRVQETKVAKTTTGPGETSIPSGGSSSGSPARSGSEKSSTEEKSTASKKAEEPGDLNEV